MEVMLKEGRMVVIEVACLMEGNGHVREVASLIEEEWTLERENGSLRENGHVTEVVILQRWPFYWMENNVTEVVSLIQGIWSCYTGGQFNGRNMVMLQRWPF